MTKLIVSVLVLLLYLTGGPAAARHHGSHVTHRYHEPHRVSGNIVTVDTAAGAIRVAADYATKFKNLIADFVAAGYNPGHVGCFATSGHVRNSRHYLGQACDFDQGARPHSAFMRTTRADTIIHKYGFTNGCSFGDCGHVGTDQLAHSHSHRYAHRHHRRTAMEIDIHLRLAALEADVAAIRNWVHLQYGAVLSPSRIDHPAIVSPPVSAIVVATDEAPPVPMPNVDVPPPQAEKAEGPVPAAG